jgi:hypothetical protein
VRATNTRTFTNNATLAYLATIGITAGHRSHLYQHANSETNYSRYLSQSATTDLHGAVVLFDGALYAAIGRDETFTKSRDRVIHHFIKISFVFLRLIIIIQRRV